MKIAFVIYNYSESGGGVEHYASDLAQVLLNRGDEVHIFCHNLKTQSSHPGLYFHSVPAASFYRPFQWLRFARNVAEMLKQEQFDVVHGFGRTYSQDIYRVGSGCHWSYLEQTHPSMQTWPGRLLQKINPRNQVVLHLEKKSFQPGSYKKIVCISQMVKNDIQRYYDVPDEDLEVIYNTVDPVRFHPDNKKKYREEVRKRFNLNEEEIILLFVGSGFERKGLRYAIDSLTLLPKDLRVRLLVVGKGRINKYKYLAERKKIADKILFLGPQAQIEQYYAAADIFLFPTLFEPFGTVCLEAMASGLPVVTSQAAGASEILTNAIDAFVLENPREVEPMAQKIIFLSDPVWRENMGQVARLTALKYSFEQHWPKVLKVYDDVFKIKINSGR